MALKPLTVSVSVVIVCHNAIAYIREALASVEAQTHQPLEVVVVDDGSSDGTPAAVARHRGKVPLRLIRFRRNQGPAKARRRGVRAARGHWIAFLDADDVWYPQKLEKQVAAVRSGMEFVYSDIDAAANDGRLIKRQALAGTYNSVYADYFRARNWPLPFFPLTSTVLVRRRLLLSLGSFDPNFRYICDDPDMWFRAMRRVGPRRVMCLTDALAMRRNHSGQIHVPMPGRRPWEVTSSMQPLLARGANLDPVGREKLLDFVYLMHFKNREVLFS